MDFGRPECMEPRLVKRVPGEATSERVVLERDMIRPSVHPGGEWIAFVPLQSDSDLVVSVFPSSGSQVSHFITPLMGNDW